MATHALASPSGAGVPDDDRDSGKNPPLQRGGADSHWEAVAERYGATANLHVDALIMMVDDEPTTTEVLQMFLEAAGYSRFHAMNDSTEAIRAMQQEPPDLLLLDLMMPEVSGFEILTAMREHDALRHIPVIMLTSSVDAETKLEALELGATDFLGKPVDPSELALRLRNTLRAKAYQDRLAYFDQLTGLPNRTLFEQKLEQAVRTAAVENRCCAVLQLDLDRFQQFNESLGHAMGDMALKAVAQRLESLVLVGDNAAHRTAARDRLVARLGGDEFGLVIPDLDSDRDAIRIAERINAAFAQPFVVADREMFISICMGVSLAPHDGGDGDTVLRKATAASAHAKQKGLKGVQFYSADLNERVSGRLHLENQLHLALDRDQFELCFQPKICLKTDRVTGAEALLRWKHPDVGYVSPGDFIPIAEQTGLIVRIGASVFVQACRRMREWAGSGHGDLGLAINVSALQFRDASFLDMVETALGETGIEARNLTIELTEGVLIENVVESVQTLERIRAMGLRVSIDDFGTGYSSLSYLRRFAIDELKIDRSFLRGLPEDRDNSAIVNSVIGLAHGLDLSVVAEGVEDVPQLEFLRQQGCHVFQGFLASRALSAGRYLEFVGIARERGWRAAAGLVEQPER